MKLMLFRVIKLEHGKNSSSANALIDIARAINFSSRC